MNLIVAVDSKWGIGKNGKLLVSLKQDMAFFRKMTYGKTVILGRKTLVSLPQGRPLKNRKHIVFSQTLESREDIAIVRSMHDLRQLNVDLEDAFVIGGEMVYRMLLPYCDKAFVTKLDRKFDADAYFPDLDADDHWEPIETINQFSQSGIAAEIVVYQNCSPQAL